jgi:hypothetical protein
VVPTCGWVVSELTAQVSRHGTLRYRGSPAIRSEGEDRLLRLSMLD